MKKKNNPITEQAKQKSCNAPVMFKKSLVRYSSFFLILKQNEKK